MFTKEDIIIQNDTIKMLTSKCDMTDYNKNTNDLYNLIIKIIDELHITSLTKISIKDINFFEKREW